ncbi:MAG: hypothetical protein ABSA41_19980 [Terriglobia bacterium]|jgi:hypothetical protein
MNRAQKRVLIGATVAALLMGAFPPWQYNVHAYGVQLSRQIGFHFLFSSPHLVTKGVYLEAHLNLGRLVVEWVTLLLASVGLLLVFNSPPKGS